MTLLDTLGTGSSQSILMMMEALKSDRYQHPPCVLIVEDDDDVREFMHLLVSTAGYDTMTARDGQEALVKMRQRRPCMVLLDLQMPRMDGWEFRARQMQDLSLSDVPVVCVTAFFDPVQVTRQLGLRCISKPADFPTIMNALETTCGSPPN